MRKRTVKLILSGESILGKGFPEMEQTIDVEDKPEIYAILCTNKNIKKWEFIVPNKYSNIQEILDVCTRLLEDSDVDFCDVKTIICITQIVCDVIIEEESTEELSKRLMKNQQQNKEINLDVNMIKTIMGKMIESKGMKMRKIWIDGIVDCVSKDIKPTLSNYINHIYSIK